MTKPFEAQAYGHPQGAGVTIYGPDGATIGEHDFTNYEEAKAFAAGVNAAARAWGWQPIETAPFGGENPCWVAHALTGTRVVAWRESATTGWRIMWCDNFIPWTPSHWMPLPPAPAPASAGGRQ